MYKYVQTKKLDGNMNLNPMFYSKGLSKDIRKEIFLKSRLAVGNREGFNGNKVYMASQDNNDGSYFEITKDVVESCDDGWNIDISEDILLISDKVPEVVIGHSVADCPVVMISDINKGVTAIGHCGAEMIDRKLPMMIVDSLVDAYGSSEDDLRVYVSACAGDNWTYNNFPKWAHDKRIWEKGIYQDIDGKFKINLRKVIALELDERMIKKENIIYNMDNTITDDNYFSNYASSIYGLNDSSKAGRNFAGMFYLDKNKIKK